MHHLGELAALGTACCWTVTSVAFTAAGRRVGSLPVNFIRLPLAFVLLAILGLVVRGHALPTDATAHAWGWLALSGLVGFTFGDLCLFRAFVLVGPRLSMLVMALVPVMTALLGQAWLGERIHGLGWLGMAATVAGVAWVVGERRAGPGMPRRVGVTGLLLAFGGALGQAVGLLLSKHGMGDYDAFAATQIRILAGGLGFALVFFPTRRWSRVGAALRDGPGMKMIAVGAVFGPFLGVSLSLLAVQHTAAGLAATIMALPPVLVLAPTWFLRWEPVTGRAAAGALLAVAGSALLFV